MKSLIETLNINEQYSKYKVTNKFAKELIKTIKDKFDEFNKQGIEAEDEDECIKAMINYPLDYFILDNDDMHKALQDCLNRIKNI